MGSGITSYESSFLPVIDYVQDWGWSLLPQYPGSARPEQGGGIPPPQSQPQTVVSARPTPVSVGQETGSTGQATRVYSVLPRREPAGPVYVPTEIVVVGDVASEVEHHPEGDFIKGDIFAPGRAWGMPAEEHGLDTLQEDEVGLSDILDWGLDTLTGQQPWQTAQWGTPQPVMGASFAQPPIVYNPTPSGVPGRPSTVITGYTGMTSSGGDCGNRRYVTLDRETGKISCRRRRRRRLLTNRDLADLASLKTITGGGAALNSAVIRAVR